jgi:hypothetical protein
MASLFGRNPQSPFGRNPQSPFGRNSQSTGQPAASDLPQVVKAQEEHAKKLIDNIALYVTRGLMRYYLLTGRLFNNTNYSDAKIHIHDVILPVHKSIICIQSDYFAKAFRPEFVEGDTGVITFKEGGGAAYWRVFEYLYTGDYSEKLSTDKFEGKSATIIFTLANLLGY